MKIKSINLVVLMMATLGLSTLASCEKKECENPVEINTDIHAYERTIIVRFKVPKDNGDTKVVISGTLYGYDADAAGVLPNPAITACTARGTGVSGHYQDNNIATAQLVTSAEIIVEQEPNEKPVTTTTSNADNASFRIDKVFSPGTYQVRVNITTNNKKNGFAVGGYRMD